MTDVYAIYGDRYNIQKHLYEENMIIGYYSDLENARKVIASHQKQYVENNQIPLYINIDMRYMKVNNSLSAWTDSLMDTHYVYNCEIVSVSLEEGEKENVNNHSSLSTFYYRTYGVLLLLSVSIIASSWYRYYKK